MKYVPNPSTASPIIGRFTWALVLTFSGNPTISFSTGGGQGNPIVIKAALPPVPCPVDSNGTLIPFLEINTTGSLELLLGEQGDRMPSGGAQGNVTISNGGVNPAGVRLFDANGAALDAQAGAAKPPGLVQIGGNDGALARALLTDVFGSLEGPNSSRLTYTWAPIGVNGAGAAAGGSAIFAIEAPAGKSIRLRRLRMYQVSAAQTTAGFIKLFLQRTTAPSTAGAVDTANCTAHDASDAAFSGIVRSSQPTVTNVTPFLDSWGVFVGATAAAAQQGLMLDRVYGENCKPLVIPAGVANGFAVSQGAATGFSGGYMFVVTFTLE